MGSGRPTSVPTEFLRHASSLVRHFASILLRPHLPISDPMQRPKPTQSFPSKHRLGSGQSSQTQTEAPATLGSPTTANDSKRSTKNPVVLDRNRTASAEDNWWTYRKNDWERIRRGRPTVQFCLFQKFDFHRDQLHVWRRGGNIISRNEHRNF